MSGNPFDSDGEQDPASAEILEGFLCPICRADLKSIDFLTDHFEREHADEGDAIKSVFKDIFTKAKRKILNNFTDDRGNSASGTTATSSGSSGAAASASTPVRPRPNGEQSKATNALNPVLTTKQTVGIQRSHFDYFQSVRNPRLERYASETNKLIIRLHRLMKDLPSDAVQRKQHEQQTVAWLDGSSVKLCPNCAKSFHIARRQHHCRLCGGIMCHDCSMFLPLENAMYLASLSSTRNETLQQVQQDDKRSLRLCHHCLRLLETRQNMHEGRYCRPMLTQVYDQIQQLKKDAIPDIEMYAKIVNSLLDGESIFTLADASALRGKIGHVAEAIDVRSKRILAIHSESGSREEALKKAIRLACVQSIKERMLSLPPLPDEAQIHALQNRKRMETEQRILKEQRMAMEAFERYGLGATTTMESGKAFAQGSDLQSLDNWSAPQMAAASASSVDDPLIEQINIIKGYIKQARQEMNFDVVETLELNLRELQREVYERQRSAKSPTTTTPDA